MPELNFENVGFLVMGIFIGILIEAITNQVGRRIRRRRSYVIHEVLPMHPDAPPPSTIESTLGTYDESKK